MPVAAIVFVPLSLLDSIPIEVQLSELSLGQGLVAAGALAAVLAVLGAALLGEVFYSGAVAVALTHEHAGRAPSLREIARSLAYRRLIAIDLIFTAVVLLGFALFFFPGAVLYIWFVLAGPVVEIERRGVRDAFRRSRELVRGRFLTVLAVLAPIELAGEGVAALAGLLAHDLFGDSFAAEWVAEAAANVVVVPFGAVAAVLLTVGLIAEKDGRGPRLHSAPPAP
ncbi:MAG TPA: hypothetical protein VFC52_06740 [Solirubrobacterales bacterium]|nr:hypothetical protein [Solirubrobacterales bacterium]